MLFNSTHFLFFFPIVVFLYFLLSPKYRWILLLAASYYFYMSWNPTYLILILTSTVITYLSGIFIYNTNSKRKKKTYLIGSLLSNLSILFMFKYFNFTVESINIIFSFMKFNSQIPNLRFLLPVGISFYTFQALSYSMDVYRGKIAAEKHFGIYALYVSFFPQLVAGPIERSDRLLPQFKKTFLFDYDRITSGLKLMLWGYFKKLVIAERLAIVVNTVYNNVYDYSGLNLIISTIFFGFQIYCDFSAYSDIARGAAQVFGYELMENFNRPYFSKSIGEFWKRWHISLSSWFRDYLYIPLGGNRVKKTRYYLNIIITFLVSGFWHGASWNFIIWGFLHGFYLIIGDVTYDFRGKLLFKTHIMKYPVLVKALKIFIVFLLVNFAWIFFRANTVSEAIYIVTNLFNFEENLFTFSALQTSLKKLHITKIEFLITSSSIVLLEVIHLIQRTGSIRDKIKSKPIIARWFMYYIIVFFILLFGKFGNNQFIYFQF